MLFVMFRREVYKILQKEGLPVPRYAVVDRSDPNFREDQVVEDDDQISINGKVFKKPFVEKPLDAEDHNVTIYFQSSAGGGCQRLFRKIGSVSSTYSSESSVRKSGSFIYEEFKPTDGCDVKIGSVSSTYSSESSVRKSGSFIYEEFKPTDGCDVKLYDFDNSAFPKENE
ncbi:inositol hexakisphosphate and diphosphoinositol-pentakisphosphate kinase 2-like [Convolutriloba macropyga]|uniref:inositol hexakisphosphate and diphosphoinositol-pentakisphosphate kinase 2-like n=1 Tax=Convolutriloba macropyga TaxID=536237 RepID=UPI003F525E02